MTSRHTSVPCKRGKRVVIGLIMAGGRGERMRGSGIDIPKPLVRVTDVPLLEWNVRAYCAAGIERIVISAAASDEEVITFARGRCADIAHSANAELSVLLEPTALGNIGCARELSSFNEAVLLTFADNLTALDLHALLTHHESLDPVLTFAVHYEPFHVPFGVLEMDGGNVVGYEEKPDLPVLISSGTSVLSSQALAAIPAGRASGISDLFQSVCGSGGVVAGYLHNAPWVDVNDASAVSRAEAMVRANPAAFDKLR
jgi:NDP-sugar pyrophosphorylase family protein